jgi:pterin-4a-carbinolamine dehydratase
MDSNSIELGSRWPDRLRAALDNSDAMLCLIGENWLRIADKYGRRRLDDEEDWVRREIELALARQIPIYPVLLGNAAMPPSEALPASLAELPNRQFASLTRANWLSDLRALVIRLEQDNMIEAHHSEFDHPAYADPDKARVPPLTEAELAAELETLDEWEPWSERILREYPFERQELRRSVSFCSFETAMEFMTEATRIFMRLNHHPRWGNEWWLVHIRLTTWDAGNKITRYDVNAAREVDELIARFTADGKTMSYRTALATNRPAP